MAKNVLHAAVGWSWDTRGLLSEGCKGEGLPSLGHPASNAGPGVWCLALLMTLL